MEESIRIMKRMMLLLIAGLLAVTAAAAMAEEADADWPEEPFAEAVSTEEACAHEHTETVYYFDAPEYFPLDGESHMVVGAAIAEIYCQDCGALVDVFQESNAQEIRSHVFRNGVCALCGYETAMFAGETEKTEAEAVPGTDADERAAEETAEWTPAPVLESVLSLPAGENPDQYTCTLTGVDLEQAGDTLVLLPDGRDTAIVVNADELRREIDGTGTFIVQIGKPGDRFISTSIRMYDAYGMESAPDGQDISLRIYVANDGFPLTVTFTDDNGTTTVEEARWAEDGYWIVPWHGDGLYSIQ